MSVNELPTSTKKQQEQDNLSERQTTEEDEIRQEQKKEAAYILEADNANKQIATYLAKKNSYWIQFGDGTKKEFDRKPLTQRQNKEIDKLKHMFLNYYMYKDKKDGTVTFNGSTYSDRIDLLYDGFYKAAVKHTLGLTDEQFEDAYWDDDEKLIQQDIWGLRSVINGITLRNTNGIAYFRQPSKNS